MLAKKQKEVDGALRKLEKNGALNIEKDNTYSIDMDKLEKVVQSDKKLENMAKKALTHFKNEAKKHKSSKSKTQKGGMRGMFPDVNVTELMGSCPAPTPEEMAILQQHQESLNQLDAYLENYDGNELGQLNPVNPLLSIADYIIQHPGYTIASVMGAMTLYGFQKGKKPVKGLVKDIKRRVKKGCNMMPGIINSVFHTVNRKLGKLKYQAKKKIAEKIGANLPFDPQHEADVTYSYGYGADGVSGGTKGQKERAEYNLLSGTFRTRSVYPDDQGPLGGESVEDYTSDEADRRNPHKSTRRNSSRGSSSGSSSSSSSSSGSSSGSSSRKGSSSQRGGRRKNATKKRVSKKTTKKRVSKKAVKKRVSKKRTYKKK